MRPATGEIRRHRRGDGGITYSLRITVPAGIAIPPGKSRRQTLDLGRDTDGWSEPYAEEERRRALAWITLGMWPPPEKGTSSGELSVVDYGRAWIDRHPEWDADTVADRNWRLHHLEPFWSCLTPSQATKKLVLQYRTEKVRESERLREASADGTPERWEHSGRARRPLGKASINKCVTVLAMILDDAAELEEWGPGGGVARGKKLRLEEDEPRRTFLEGDEAALFIIAARHIDRWGSRPESEQVAREIVRLRDDLGLPWREIARRTGRAMSTAHYHHARITTPSEIGVNEALAITLLAGGMRATENADMTLEDLRVLGRHFVVPGTKTDAARRSSDMTPGVYGRMSAYVDSRGQDGPESPAFPYGDRHGVRKFVQRVAERARLLARRDGRSFPAAHVTPHDLRRTCVALMLSSGYDLAFVQDHIGNKSSRLVLEVYNKVQERKDRSCQAREFDGTLFADLENPV